MTAPQAAETADTTMRDLFRLGQARLYFTGLSLSLFGDNVLALAAGVWVKTLTGNNAAGGLVTFFILVPTLFAPLFGVLADRVRKRRLMIVTNAVMAVVSLTLLFVRDAGDVRLIYLVMLAYGIALVTHSSAQSGLFVTMFPERFLGTANSAYTSMQEGMKVIAPAVGAALFVWLGGGLVGLLNGITYLLACATLWALSVRESAPQPRERHLLTEISSGFRHIATVPELRRLVFTSAIVMLTAGFITIALFGVVDSELHRPPAFLGLVISMQGIGSVVSGLTAPSLIASIGETRMVGFGAALITVGTAVLLVPAEAVVLPGNVLRGIGLGWMLIGAITLMQRRTAVDLLGRTASALYMLLFTPSVVAVLAGAGLSELVGHRTLVIVSAVLVAGACVFLLARSTAGPPMPNHKTT